MVVLVNITWLPAFTTQFLHRGYIFEGTNVAYFC